MGKVYYLLGAQRAKSRETADLLRRWTEPQSAQRRAAMGAGPQTFRATRPINAPPGGRDGVTALGPQVFYYWDNPLFWLIFQITKSFDLSIKMFIILY